IKVTQANQRLEGAKLNLAAAQDKALAIVSKGRAEASVKVMKNKAEVAGIETNVAAFGSGEAYADYLLRIKLAPNIQYIWSNTEGTFADWLTNLLKKPPAEDGKHAPATEAKP